MYIIDEQGLLKYQGAIDDAGGRGFMSKDLLKANNYVKQCFGLYCKVVESSKDDGRHYWKLIGIPQLNICMQYNDFHQKIQ